MAIFIWAAGTLLAACSQAPLPTAEPVAAVPTATATGLPPTTDLSQLAPTPVPTLTPPPPRPTATAPPVDASITIVVPDEGTAITQGSEIVARGLVRLESTSTVWLALVGQNGRLLAQTQARVSEVGWEGNLTVPPVISGYVRLQAGVLNEREETLALDEILVRLDVAPEGSDRYLALFHPLLDETAVGGFNIFFDGLAQRPVNNTVTISIWTDGCQTRVAHQSFVLRGSGYWQGFVVVPRDVAGPACAIAHFGTPGEDPWREAHIPINILNSDDDNARGVRIGNPPPESTVTAGQELLLYGTALNASESEVSISILLDNGRIIDQSLAITDFWGYWEQSVRLPIDVEGQAEITASHGDPNDGAYAETTTLITIEPAPTPAPAGT